MIRVLPADQRRAELGQYIRFARVNAGLTVDQLAELITRNAGTARMHGLVLTMIEEGRHLPTEEYTARIAAVVPINPRMVRALAARSPSAKIH